MSIGITSIPGSQYTLFCGYVAIPQDLEREVYIRDCYINNQICIITEDGGFYSRVPISQEILNFIDFPLTAKEIGTPLLLGTEDIHKQVMVLTRLHSRDKLGNGREHQFQFRRIIDGQLVEISGSAKDAALNILVDGNDNPGLFNINLFNKNKNCQFKVNIAGSGTIASSEDFIFNQDNSFITETFDKEEENVSAKFEQTSRENRFKNEKLIVNKGSDPLALGNELKSFLISFIDQVSNITVATAIGLQPILNKPQVLALKNQLDTILSKVIFTDK